MGSIYELALQGLDLQGKTILDAATGAGEATKAWAQYIHKNKLGARIISVDIDQPAEWVAKIEEDLGPLKEYVELRQASIYDLNFLPAASIDIINCDDTLVFLNPQPLKLLSALEEFARVLRPGGDLVIISEYPPQDSAEAYGQWQRWNLAKAVWALNGETWSTEPQPEPVQAALALLGFEDFHLHRVPGGRLTNFQETIQEWQEVLMAKIAEIPWPMLRQALRDQVQSVRDKIVADGYLMISDMYVLKCVRGTGS